MAEGAEEPPVTVVKISKYALEELVVVQKSGLTNMFDRNKVLEIAEQLELNCLQGWIATHTPEQWFTLIIGKYEVPDA